MNDVPLPTSTYIVCTEEETRFELAGISMPHVSRRGSPEMCDGLAHGAEISRTVVQKAVVVERASLFGK